MQIYVTKNNQQLGPFEETKVLDMLRAGQLSGNDMAFRQGDRQWQKLGSLYPNVINSPNAAHQPNAAYQPKIGDPAANFAAPAAAPAITAPAAASSVAPLTAPKKSRKGLLLGCGGIFIIGLAVAGILGFLGFRNMNPPDSTENLPNAVGELKLDTRYPPKGDVWGSEANYVGLYRDESKVRSVLYLMTVYKDEAAAKAALTDGLSKSCKGGEKQMNFSFLDKNDKELSQGATCAAPLYVQKDNKLVAIGGSGGSAETFIEFAENLPFNAGSKMKMK